MNAYPYDNPHEIPKLDPIEKWFSDEHSMSRKTSMFKRNRKTNTETTDTSPDKRRRINWFKVSVFANVAIVVLVVLGLGGMEIIHQSDTNPSFCASCHIMESHVDSYLNGSNLDHIHAQAGVQCKDCHDFPLSEEIRAGIAFFTSDYEVDEEGELVQRDFGDEICTQCHVSLENVKRQTDFLYYNPHDTNMGVFTCNTCHISHGEQIDYCNECHYADSQRMVGDDTPRVEQLGEDIPYIPW
jgi:hypothetical protein